MIKSRMEAFYSELILACSLAPTEFCILQPRIYTLEVFFTYLQSLVAALFNTGCILILNTVCALETIKFLFL